MYNSFCQLLPIKLTLNCFHKAFNMQAATRRCDALTVKAILARPSLGPPAGGVMGPGAPMLIPYYQMSLSLGCNWTRPEKDRVEPPSQPSSLVRSALSCTWEEAQNLCTRLDLEIRGPGRASEWEGESGCGFSLGSVRDGTRHTYEHHKAGVETHHQFQRCTQPLLWRNKRRVSWAASATQSLKLKPCPA